jgi:hypothetical protein
MAVQNAPDSQKVDYLWKKIVYGAAKTDIAGNIDATQEPYASPLQIRGDRIMQQSDQIPAVLPGSSSGVVTVYPTSSPKECTNDAGIPTPQLTWVTGTTNWIPPEFGSTYQVKVYISPSGQPGNVLTRGTQVFATGSGNNDEWVFDYQAGILNFNSNNTPYSAGGTPISFTGNSVYISGGVYSGAFGLPTATSVGNLTFSNTTISTSWASANIYLNATGTGTVQIGGNIALGLPVGNTAARPTNAVAGYIRFNSDTNVFEYFDGTQWDIPGAATITSATVTPDGTANTFPLGYTATSAGIIVSINGTLQQPGNAYNVVGNSITFTEIPLITDIIEIRKIAAGVTSVTSLQYGADTSVTLDSANVTIQGNVLPSATNTYDLGSNSLEWRNIYTAGIVSNPANVAVTANTTVTVDSYNKTVYRTAKYVIQSTSSIGVESYEAMVIHNGASSAYVTVYGVINTGSALGNITATVLSNTVQVQYTAFSNNANVRITKNYITL